MGIVAQVIYRKEREGKRGRDGYRKISQKEVHNNARMLYKVQ